MREWRIDKFGQRWAVACAVMIAAVIGWYMLLSESLSYPVGVQEYGFPITFKRVYRPTVVQFFPRPLYFDLAVATLVVSACGYSFWIWSGVWSKRVRIAILVVPVLYSICYLCLILHWVPWQVALPMLVLILVIPITWIVSLPYASFSLGRSFLGKSRAFLFPLGLAFLLIGAGWWCWPHDIFWNTGDRSKIPDLVKNLMDENPEVRSLSLLALRRLGPFDETAASAIIQAMTDPDQQVREDAIRLAPDLGPLAVNSVPILLQQFVKDGGCTFELAQLGPIAKDAIPALEERLPRTKSYEKLGITRALWNIDGKTTLVVPALIELLQDDFGPIRVDAATLLGEIGPEAKEAVPLLQRIVDYKPQADSAAPKETTAKSSGPVIRQVTEAEFYPRIRSAAETALRKIMRQR
jgi:HEAT repeat protein